jgi:hypothetical protein
MQQAESEHTPGPSGYDAELRRHNEVLRRAVGVQLHDHTLDIAVELGRQPDRPHARPRQGVRSGSTSPRPRSSAPASSPRQKNSATSPSSMPTHKSTAFRRSASTWQSAVRPAPGSSPLVATETEHNRTQSDDQPQSVSTIE